MRTRSTLTTAVLASALLATSAWGATRVFGRAGETLSVLSDSYSSLFPNGSAAGASDPVLALEIRDTRTGAVERLLVPGTGDPRLELSPSIVFEPTSERAYLVWEGRTNSIHSQILIGSYGTDGWTEPIEVNNGSSYALKGSPQVAVSRDRFVEAGEGGATQHSRTVVHVLWWQEAGVGSRTFYAPVTIVDGFAPRTIAPYDLSDLDSLLPQADGGTSGDALRRHPVLLSGRDDRRIVVAFIGATTGLLAGIELEVLPRETAELADRARGHIIDLAANPTLSRPTLAARIADLRSRARDHLPSAGGGHGRRTGRFTCPGGTRQRAGTRARRPGPRPHHRSAGISDGRRIRTRQWPVDRDPPRGDRSAQ